MASYSGGGTASSSSSSARRLKKTLRSTAKSVTILVSLVLLPFSIYTAFIGAVGIQDGFPVLTQLVSHSQRVEWGFFTVYGSAFDKSAFILDWRSIAYDNNSLRGQAWNMQTWFRGDGEREVVLSSFGLCILGWCVALFCTVFHIFYVYDKYSTEGESRYYLLLNYSALAKAMGIQACCHVVNALLVVYMVLSGYRALVDQIGSHVFFGPAFATLLGLAVISTICFAFLWTASRDIEKEIRARRKRRAPLASSGKKTRNKNRSKKNSSDEYGGSESEETGSESSCYSSSESESDVPCRGGASYKKQSSRYTRQQHRLV